jgi:hypothetical protein
VMGVATHVERGEVTPTLPGRELPNGCDGWVRLVDLLEYESVDNQHWDSVADDYVYGPVSGVLARKRRDAHYPKLLSELKERGFTTGINVHPYRERVCDGHHRIAAALDLGMEYVPVKYKGGTDADSGRWGKPNRDFTCPCGCGMHW